MRTDDCIRDDGDCGACGLSSYGLGCGGRRAGDRTKAALKATRETIGMSQQLMADLLGVDVRSVKRWEQPGNGWDAPDDAWNLLARHLGLQECQVYAALDRIYEAAEEHGAEPERVSLAYWSSADHYAASNPDDDRRMWQMGNATVRRVAAALSDMCVNVRFSYAGTGDGEEG